jgi:hypothetical protein
MEQSRELYSWRKRSQLRELPLAVLRYGQDLHRSLPYQL